MDTLEEYDGKKHYIRHIKTPDGTIKNDCLIRALCEVTGRSYYNICQKLKAPYEVSSWHHSVPESFPGVTLHVYERAFKDQIQDIVEISSNPYCTATVIHEAEFGGKLPTVAQFAKAWSRRKIYAGKKLILHTISLQDNMYHAIYCKSGYYYDSTNVDSRYVTRVDVFK